MVIIHTRLNKLIKFLDIFHRFSW